MDVEELVESIIRASMFLAGILGNNWLLVRSLPKRMSEIRTNDVLFLNLAVSNLITNYLVDLPDTIADFAGRWFLGEAFCGVFRFSADLSETSSIYTTFFISIYWYQKLVGSLKRGGAPVQLDSLRLVAGLLACSWAVALVFSIPHFFFVEVTASNDSHEDCVDVYPDETAMQVYEILYLTLANAVPVTGFVYASLRIVITLLQNHRRIEAHKSNPKEKVTVEKKDTEEENENSTITAADPSTPKDQKLSSSHTSIYNGTTTDRTGSEDQQSGQSSHDAPLSVTTTAEASKPSQMPAKVSPGSGVQVRAAKSVVAVAIVFLVCWMTHLLLRITNNIHTSPLVLEVASYIAASYTCIIPYIFLYGVKKLSCSCRR
ncbi:C-X-C chemokine receptor type 4 [Genypterus blacodes]|uniref:C-X-C chemokine receptor type 4 n=1 Tax=Genypterus blacodes TaxID=154954 RepID=UPI003F769E4A